MKVVRVLTYESDDATVLAEQLGLSKADGVHKVHGRVTLKIQTVSSELLTENEARAAEVARQQETQ